MASGVSYAGWFARNHHVWGRYWPQNSISAISVALVKRWCLQLISLSDLENDFVNPHDASAAINKWVVSLLCSMPTIHQRRLLIKCACSLLNTLEKQYLPHGLQ